MNPNAMAQSPPRLMQDVMPPYAPATTQTMPTASPPQPIMNAPSSSAPTPPQPTLPTEPVAAEATAAQSPPVPQPMFPVVAETRPAPVHATLQGAVPSPAAQTQIPASQASPIQAEAPSASAKAHTNWFIIILAVAVAGGLAYAAYLAFKSSS